MAMATTGHQFQAGFRRPLFLVAVGGYIGCDCQFFFFYMRVL